MESQMCADSTVVVVGGANSAGQAAVFLAERASSVLLLIRGDDLNKGMSRCLARRIEQMKNIDILTNTEVTQIAGNTHLESVEIRNNRSGKTRMVNTSAVFALSGAKPHTDWLPEGVDTDEKGFIKTGPCICVCLAWGQYDPKSRPTTKANSRDLSRVDIACKMFA